jgi:hypothetical protein
VIFHNFMKRCSSSVILSLFFSFSLSFSLFLSFFCRHAHSVLPSLKQVTKLVDILNEAHYFIFISELGAMPMVIL